MNRVAGAVLALALIGAAPHAAPARHAPRTPVIVRASVVSGNGQTARAWAAPAAARYITEFPRPLVVAIADGRRSHGKRSVRFHCVTAGCILAPTEDVDRVDPSTYDATVTNGRATVSTPISAAQPGGSFTITADPVVDDGERSVPTSFTLTTR